MAEPIDSKVNEHDYFTNKVEVEEITKRSIGKLIVKYCGNEGVKDDDSSTISLRALLQQTITKLDTEPAETWRNAEIVIYDESGNDFCIRSGKAKNKFVVQVDEKGDVKIICTGRKRKGIRTLLGR